MIHQITKPKVAAALAGLLLGSYNVSMLAQQSDVLDPSQHPKSPEAERIYTSDIVPLNATLSWTKRFNGDETFSAEQINVSEPSMVKMDMAVASSHTMSDMNMDANGVVKSVKLNQGKVKISHGPIDKYGMPSMTMMFKVKDAAMLKNISKGEKIGFNVDNTSGGFVVTELMSMAKLGASDGQTSMNAATTMDASGVVKQVRASQGKVKISHGPIEKYGMPGMTMMFKVKDPSLLGQLEKGAKVDFDIDNSSGGFVITNIKPAIN
ncbi:MAG: Cu(I)/Ag(I) efflux system protein CusF [Saprospiraceae bacterium]|jgi:Cu(I)/Ag(I) efflux system protein CusF